MLRSSAGSLKAESNAKDLLGREGHERGGQGSIKILKHRQVKVCFVLKLSQRKRVNQISIQHRIPDSLVYFLAARI